MNKNVLKPARVFEQFARINQIPRPSKHEEQVVEYLKRFGEERNLETVVDDAGNVLIRKAATKGMEDRQAVILQSHMDMVCEKVKGLDFDFQRDPIQTVIEGDWMKAKGTTLGADDGIGMALALAILDSDDVEHGPLECVFTRDEETGLTGAQGMKAGFMTGKMLINLDSEDEGQFFVSCAGGQTATATFRYTRVQVPDGYFFLSASVDKLKGGHSGDDIDKKRANAVKLLARFLYMESEKLGGELYLADFHCGKLHNAIPRDGEVIFAVKNEEKENVRADWNVFAAQVEDEFHVTEPDCHFHMGSAEARTVLPQSVGTAFIRALQAVDNGPMCYCQDEALAWMVETSSNVASVHTAEESAMVTMSQRSNVMSNLDNMTNTVKAAFQLAGAEVSVDGRYPAWKMRADSELTRITVETYRQLFGKEPKVIGIHAGLECGLFSERYPDLDMVSMGPTLRGVHSPDERLLIPTVDMVWRHLLEILKNIPA